MLKPIEADKELKLAARLTPGPWEQHSIFSYKRCGHFFW